MHPSRTIFVLAAGLFSLAACSAPAPSDGGADGARDASDAIDAVTPCATDQDCNDNVFCNGVERCNPGLAGADARGCVRPSPATPCLSGQTCNEATRRCDETCGSNPDVDGDGHRSTACGGDDCDDADANRYPGNTEVCAIDSATGMRVDPTHDEDCDPNTIANPVTLDGDLDHDTYVDRACCNDRVGGQPFCGNDCADTTPVMGMPGDFMTTVAPASIHPTQVELCNGIDDNCVAGIDEGLAPAPFYADCDGDGDGDAAATASMACGRNGAPRCNGHEASASHTDCDDTNSSVHLGASEVCNGLDDNCDGAVDEDLPGALYYPDCDGDGYGDMSSTGVTACAPGIAPLCMGHPAVSTRTDCNDARPEVHPSGLEVCNGRDDDCDGRIDSGCPATIDVGGTSRLATAIGSTSGSLTMQRCPAGQVVSEVSFHTSTGHLDGIGVHCERPVATHTGDPYSFALDAMAPSYQVTPVAGTAVGTYTHGVCPTGYVGRGLLASSPGTGLGSAAITCTDHAIDGSIGMWTVATNSGGVTVPFNSGNSTICAPNEVMIGANFYEDTTSVHGIAALCVVPRVTLLP